MMRRTIAFLCGAVFGLGLVLSGMTDTQKVQGFLDPLGAWDPTLAFVMGGALIPMTLAWRLTRGRAPHLGGAFPSPPGRRIDSRMVTGALMFGAGWGLVGLCPGPALAALPFGGPAVAVFVLAMVIGMRLAPALQSRVDGHPRSA